MSISSNLNLNATKVSEENYFETETNIQLNLFADLSHQNSDWNPNFSSNSSTKKTKNLTFMDFCAGIGGGRLGLTNLGMECVGFSEINKEAEKTYRLFFGEHEKNFGDLMRINPIDLPDFDLMIAGFPCQTFSVIGQRRGFGDHRGQVIYGLIDILQAKNVKYFILENVKGLVNHDKGKTIEIILRDLDAAGYQVNHRVLNSENYGVPQSRERVYFVGVRKDLYNSRYQFPIPQSPKSLSEYLVDSSATTINQKDSTYTTFLKYLNNKYNQISIRFNRFFKTS
jgi:DNA (cytosine-5)-methyltransferase 1